MKKKMKWVVGGVNPALRRVAAVLWSHRGLYAGLAAASGGVCLGFEPELMKQIIAGCYVGLLVKG